MFRIKKTIKKINKKKDSVLKKTNNPRVTSHYIDTIILFGAIFDNVSPFFMVKFIKV